MTTPVPTLKGIRDAWESVACGYDEFITPQTIQHGEDALRRLDISPGTRFLDVAAGSGALSIPAARRGAQVTAIDFAPTMIEQLSARTRAEGLLGIEAREMDCHALDFAADTFDVAASQNGVTMSANLAVALAEMVRVTKPGGTVLMAAFGPLVKAEFLGFFVGAVTAVVPGFTGLPSNPPPPPFQLADRDAFRNELIGSGLTDTSVHTTSWDMPVESAVQLWNEVTFSNPIGGGWWPD